MRSSVPQVDGLIARAQDIAAKVQQAKRALTPTDGLSREEATLVAREARQAVNNACGYLVVDAKALARWANDEAKKKPEETNTAVAEPK